ncbi:CAP domain-containing protein [Bryocella elongata]|uniref:CAP domain-containing protein n=1 Tax=Bryocella elongata TaxID=863522 RepID=UPI001356EF62|nr:CAP domain-containing protein [Bryocella elongata]
MAQRSPTSLAEQYLFQSANQERASRGLPPLRWDASLYHAAYDHAREMAARETISHQFPGESELEVRGRYEGARFSLIAENVAMAPSVAVVHTAWMNSPGHRANLLDPRVDSIGISVLRRGNELYAVQDFDRSVKMLSLDEQEQRVATLVASGGAIDLLPATEDARRTCQMESGYAGERQPWFVMRYTAADLEHLPDALRERLGSGRYHQAAIGACPARDTKNFSAFNIAVLLYP